MKVRIIILSAILLIEANVLNAQVLDSVPDIDSLVNSGQICFDPVAEEDTIYNFVELMPEYPGGDISLKKYIAENFKLPVYADIVGTIYLKFEVQNTGDVGKIQILRGLDPYLDQEAIRVIKTLPAFKPGIQKGKSVNVWYIIPIKIELN